MSLDTLVDPLPLHVTTPLECHVFFEWAPRYWDHKDKQS